MKAFLLAAGNGTRLRPLTDHTPKCLLPVRGRPILDWWLDRCFASGISEVLLNIHAHAGQVLAHVAQGPWHDRVRVSEERVLLGSAGTIAENHSWVGEGEDFWVLYADVLTTVDLQAFRESHLRFRPPVTLGVTEVQDPRRCGIVTLDDQGLVANFEEKPARPATNLAFSGIMIGTSEFLQAIPSKRPADIGYDVLPQIAGMRVFRIVDFLLDIGTHENYKKAEETWPLRV